MPREGIPPLITMAKPVEFRMPQKGVVKVTSFSDHSADAALDACNVMPFGRSGRLRLTQRQGLSKVYSSLMGEGSNVRFMQQVTRYTLQAMAADNLLFEEVFADHTGLSYVSEIDGGATWRTCQRWASGENATELTTALAINAGGYVVENVAADAAAALYLPAAMLGNTYSTRVRVSYQVWTQSIYLDYRVDKSTYNQNGILVGVALKDSTHLTVIWYVDNAVRYVATDYVVSAKSLDTQYDVEVVVQGNMFTLIFDGTTIVSRTITDRATNNGVGFKIFNGHSTRVYKFAIYVADQLATLRLPEVIYVVGGNVYQGDLDSVALVTNGSSVVAQTALFVSGAFSQNFMYLVDGVSILKVDLATKAMIAYVATAGTAPTGCTIACMYRDRLVLAAPESGPQNFFASRMGVHTDWDYTQNDSGAAWAGNASVAGRIGEPIVALIPYADDMMLIGGDHNLWVLRGDLADGGSIDQMSDATGILGPNAWCISPDGTVYFVGTGGLFRMRPNGGLEPLANETWKAFFSDIDRETNWVQMTWDRDNFGAFVFVTPVNSGSAIHLWYDARTGGIWPIQFPNAVGPVSVTVFDGSGPLDRCVFLGGRDGHVYRPDWATMSDAGTAISSYIVFGPYKSSDVTETTLEWLDVILGEPEPGWAAGDYKVTVSVLSGQTIERALNSPVYTRSKTFTGPYRQVRWIQRTRGAVLLLKLSNSTLNKVWNFEKAVGVVMDGGLVRRR